MKKITFDKPKSAWPARVAFAAAAAAVALAAWYFTKSDYEPVRLLTPEEQAALSKDPARYPAPKNWEDSFITEKVPGEGRAEEGNAWTRAAEATKSDPDDSWSPRDEIEKGICDLSGLVAYRLAQQSWAAFQAQPATAQQRYDLINLAFDTDLALAVTGVDHDSRIRMRQQAARMALAEKLAQPVPADPIEAYEYYKILTGYYFNTAQDQRASLGINADVLHDKLLTYRDAARQQRMVNFISLYRQGLMSEPAGVKNYQELMSDPTMQDFFWKSVPDQSDEDYQDFKSHLDEYGLSVEEARGIAGFLNTANERSRETALDAVRDVSRVEDVRGLKACPS